MVRRFFLKHRRRLSRLIAVGGLLTVGLLLSRSMPREHEVEVELGPAHHEVVEVRIEYRQGRDSLHGVALSFPQGAPSRVHHSVSLPEGDFEVYARMHKRGGESLASVSRLHAPSDGTVVIRMPEAARR